MKVALKEINRKAKKSQVELSDQIFDRQVDKDVLARMVNWQLAKRQSGLHKVKERGEITGTTKKPFRQKGTGSARLGDRKVSQLRGGGVAHGPRVRSHAHDLPKKVRKAALSMALSVKAKEKDVLHIVEDLKMKDHKTKNANECFPKDQGSVLVVYKGELDKNFKLAVRNLYWVDVLDVDGLNVYDLLKHEHIMMTKDALQDVEERLAS